MSENVTVVIYCYNNLEYIYQALDSVLCQTYDNIQLIISDDCSDFFPKDKIEEYIETNRNNIKDYIVRQNDKNLGTVRHINRVLKLVRGEYYLGLAVDDVLMNNKVIEKIMENINDDGNTIFVGQVEHFDKNLDVKICDSLSSENISIMCGDDTEELFANLCKTCFIPAPGVVYNINLLKKLGGFDEKYELVEDWPLYLKAVRQGVHFQYMDFVISKHRSGGISHSKRKKGNKKQEKYYNDLIKIMRNEIVPYFDLLKNNRNGIKQQVRDSLIIAEYKQRISDMPLFDKIKWLCKQKGGVGIVLRGIMRKIRRRFINEW